MKIIGKNVTKAEADLVVSMVKRCVRLLRKNDYELNLTPNASATAIDCLRLRRTPSQRSSYGGQRFISINLADTGTIFHEYKSFNKEPHIGGIDCGDPEMYLFVLIAHEVSHFIQYTYAPRVRRFRESYQKPHGKCFRDIYRYLRRDLVNPAIAARWENHKSPADAGS